MSQLIFDLIYCHNRNVLNVIINMHQTMTIMPALLVTVMCAYALDRDH